MKKLQDRVAVVTGAASGIGRALAEALARKGCEVALVDVDEAGLSESAERVRAHGRKASTHRADVADREQMQRLPAAVIAEHGAVHVLINNAGVNAEGSFGDLPLEDFEWVVGVNFWGVVHGTRFFLPHLRAADEAHIVNLSSMFGLVGMPEASAYCSTKFAVRGFSEALYAELSDTKIGVTSVHPGGIRTNIVRNQRLREESMREERAQSFERVARTSPEHAAERIVRAIERNKLSLRIAPETWLVDWAKRLFPTGTHRLIAWAYRRNGAML